MNQWAARNPEAYERGERQGDVPERELEPCVCCGRLTRQRWCSTGCFEMEDGPHEEEN